MCFFFSQNTHWAFLLLTRKSSNSSKLNTIAVGVRLPLTSYSTETAWWKESLHLFLISTQLLTRTPLQWACFQGDKHHVSQQCEAWNNIVFIVCDGWNFLISVLKLREYAGMLLLLVNVERDLYCLSIFFSTIDHFTHTGNVWFATSNRARCLCFILRIY